jgi:hypothetical protein
VRSISDENETMYFFDPNKSIITESIMLTSDLRALGEGNVKGVKLAGGLSIEFVLYPIPKE